MAGQFYPADGEGLAHAVERCFLDRRGPGELPVRHRRPDRHLRAIIVPHAGLVYSGAIAALAFAQVAAERPPAHVVILGVDHHGLARGAAVSVRPWETPLGPVAPDEELAARIARPPVAVDEAAHRLEHSIEVELPFLQYVVPAPRHVPIMVRFGPFDYLRSVGERVRDGIADHDVLLIASTDFSHYVPAVEAERLDRLAIDEILRRDAGGLYRTVVDRGISMCGVAPTTALLAALEDEPLRARLLRWGHSGEVEPMAEVVGYAAIALESDRPLPPEASPARGGGN